MFLCLPNAYACEDFEIERAEPRRTLSLRGVDFVLVINLHGTFSDERRDAEII